MDEIKALNVLKQVVDLSISNGVFKSSDEVSLIHTAYTILKNSVNSKQAESVVKEAPKATRKRATTKSK